MLVYLFFSSISAILVTMLLMGVLLLAGGNIDAFTENVEKEVKIHVSIDSLTKDEQIEKLNEIWSEAMSK